MYVSNAVEDAPIVAVLVPDTENCQRSAGAPPLQEPFASLSSRLPFKVCPKVIAVPGGGPDRRLRV